MVLPIKYKPKPGEQFFTNERTGKKIHIKPKNEVVKQDNRSTYQKNKDQKESEQIKKTIELQKRYLEGLEALSGISRLVMPSTYIGPIVRNSAVGRIIDPANSNNKLYINNTLSGEGFGDGTTNVVFDLASPFAAKSIASSISLVKNLGNSIYHANTSLGQHLRYAGGKFKFGFDAKLPDLIRRTQNPMPKLHITRKNSPVIVTPLNNRFVFLLTGLASPVITNFTTDLPVIPNNGGSWWGFDINIIDGKLLLGKNVISTRPMDTFTYGDKIVVPKSSIKTISSRKGLIPEELLMLEFHKKYRRPTLKDYLFMDYVFLPKYTSEVIPNTPLTVENVVTHPLGKYLFNADTRPRLNLPWNYVMYDIAPTAESEYRDNLGIILRNLYKF